MTRASLYVLNVTALVTLDKTDFASGTYGPRSTCKHSSGSMTVCEGYFGLSKRTKAHFRETSEDREELRSKKAISFPHDPGR